MNSSNSTQKLKNILNIINGGTPSTKIEEYWGDEIPWITPKDLSNFNNRFIYSGERNLSNKGLKNSSAKLLPEGTILFSSRAPIGYVAIAGQQLSTNQGFKNLVCNKDLVDNIYLYYWLFKNAKQIEKRAVGSTFAEISKSDMEDLEINLPPLPEQKRIASILSSFDNKIELLREQNKTLENIAQTIFKEWFVNYNFPDKDGKPYKDNGGKMIESELGMIPKGWRVESLDNVTSLITDGSHFSPKSQHTGYPMASVKDMTEWQIDLSSCRKISEKDYKKLLESNCAPKKGDILIAKDGSYLKHVFIQHKEEPFVVLSSIAFLRTNERLNPYLLNLILKLKSTLVRMENIVSGAVIRRIILKDFKSFEIIIPSIETQKLITTHIEDSYKKIWNNINEIEKLEESKNILIKKLIK